LGSRHAFDSFADASIYPLSTMTTSEIPGLTVPSRFPMISALEAVNGVLLFGISTAFHLAVIQVHWQLVSRRHPAAGREQITRVRNTMSCNNLRSSPARAEHRTRQLTEPGR
jgi:hypothetical protein